MNDLMVNIPLSVAGTVQSAGVALLASYFGGHKFTNVAADVSHTDAAKMAGLPVLAFLVVTSVADAFFKGYYFLGIKIKKNSDRAAIPGLAAGALTFSALYFKTSIPLAASLVYAFAGAAFSIGPFYIQREIWLNQESE